MVMLMWILIMILMMIMNLMMIMILMMMMGSLFMGMVYFTPRVCSWGAAVWRDFHSVHPCKILEGTLVRE